MWPYVSIFLNQIFRSCIVVFIKVLKQNNFKYIWLKNGTDILMLVVIIVPFWQTLDLPFALFQDLRLYQSSIFTYKTTCTFHGADTNTPCFLASHNEKKTTKKKDECHFDEFLGGIPKGSTWSIIVWYIFVIYFFILEI